MHSPNIENEKHKKWTYSNHIKISSLTLQKFHSSVPLEENTKKLSPNFKTFHVWDNNTRIKNSPTLINSILLAKSQNTPSQVTNIFILLEFLHESYISREIIAVGHTPTLKKILAKEDKMVVRIRQL